MNTTMTSNKNFRGGKVSSNNTQYDYSERKGCGGYALLSALIVVLGVIVYFIVTHS